MVGKTSVGSGAAGVLEYCFLEKDKKNEKAIRGEILFCQNLTLQKLQNDNKMFDMKNLAKQFDEVASLNSRMQKFIWHQSFSFPIDEKPTTEQVQEIILEFSKEFGFEDNQLIAFRHSDTAHEHFHIVANRLNVDGMNTANQYNNFRRVGQFCRRMEQKLELKPTLGMISDPKQNRKENVISSRYTIFIKSKIDEYLLLVNSIEELKEALLKEEIETEIGRGISFKYQNERFKGSDLGREYSLMNLERRLESKSDLKETLANEPFSLTIEYSNSNSNLEDSELSKEFSLVNLEKELKSESNFEKSIDSNPKLENSKLGNEFSFTNSEKELKLESNFEETFKNESFSLKTESSNSNSNFKDSKLGNEFSSTNSEKELKPENNFEETFKNESFSLKIESSNTETEDTPAAATSIKLGIETSGGGAPPAIKSNSMDEEEKKRLQKLKMKNKMKR